MDEDRKELLPTTTTSETIADIATVVASVVPWVGGPVSAVLAGISLNRKIERIRGVLTDMADQIKNVTSEEAKNYVQTEDFQDLLEKTLRQSADERVQEKRKAYAAFLANDISMPGQDYDEKLRILRTLEQVQMDHIRVLKALLQEPDYGSITGSIGSVRQTLEKRLPDLDGTKLIDLAEQLATMRLTNSVMFTTMMTARGAEELQHIVTPYGRRFLEFVHPNTEKK
jgi:dsDNA-binding SOS-regulon protein